MRQGESRLVGQEGLTAGRLKCGGPPSDSRSPDRTTGRAIAQHDSALSQLARRLTEVDGTLASSIGEILGAALQEMIEAELTARIGAEPGERSPVACPR